jgi:hypothetical protein
MAPGLPRTSPSRTPLTRLLQGHVPEAGSEGRLTFAEQLSQWLGWTDAIALSAVLGGGHAQPANDAAPDSTMSPQILLDRVGQVRAELAHAIRTDTVLAPPPPAPPARPRVNPGRRAPAPPPPPPAALRPADDPADFASCRRQLQAHQRAMAEHIAPLRAALRAALAQRSSALGGLAALDAVMDDALAAREKHVLSLVPAWLEQRFHERRRTHAPGPHGSMAAEGTPAQPEPVPTWRIASGQEMQDVLLAELDLRLQPVQGLADALAQDITRQ